MNQPKRCTFCGQTPDKVYHACSRCGVSPPQRTNHCPNCESQGKRITELEALCVDYKDSQQQRFLEWRWIRDARHGLCGECKGAGVKLYGSTSTWRGGIGGCAMTTDVCDACWGSGTNRAWTSHRRITELESAAVVAQKRIAELEEQVDALYKKMRDESND